jgi:alkyl hydroperoxide reductase subunit AhpC
MRGMSSLNVRMLTGVSLAVFFNNYNETARMVREILQSTQAYQMNEMDEIVNPPEWKDPE